MEGFNADRPWWRREPHPVNLFLLVVSLVSCLGLVAVFCLDSKSRTVPNVVLIVQTCLIAVGLLSLVFIARQVRIVREQARSDQVWRKTLSYHQFFGDLVTTEVREKIAKVATECGFLDARQNGEPISTDAVKKIKKSPKHDAVIATYLDEFEEFCGAVHAGLLDRDYAYTLEATRIIRAWRLFEPYVIATRLETRDHRTYIELERLGENWRERRKMDDDRDRKARLDLTASNGVKGHV